MRYIKTFEAWGGQPLPVTNVGSLMSYIICKDCNAVYKVFNKPQSNCAYCQSKDVSLTDIDTYYNEIVSRLDDEEEIEDILKQKQIEEEGFIDLVNIDFELGKNQSLRNADKKRYN